MTGHKRHEKDISIPLRMRFYHGIQKPKDIQPRTKPYELDTLSEGRLREEEMTELDFEGQRGCGWQNGEATALREREQDELCAPNDSDAHTLANIYPHSEWGSTHTVHLVGGYLELPIFCHKGQCIYLFLQQWGSQPGLY